MESTHSGLIAAQLSQVGSSRKGWLVPERAERKGWGWGGDPHCLCHHLRTQHCGKANWTVCAPDGAFSKGDTCSHLSVFFLNCEKFCVRKAFVDSSYGSGLKLDCLGCGLECWCGAPKLWHVAHSSRTTWTCLVSPRCQSCLGECVCVCSTAVLWGHYKSFFFFYFYSNFMTNASSLGTKSR